MRNKRIIIIRGLDNPIFKANTDIAICVGLEDNTEYNNALYCKLCLIKKSPMY
jgi:hypothetical protein